MQIVYIDDDDDDKAIFSEALEVIAPMVICIIPKSLWQAIQILKERVVNPDLIFIDINIATIRGKEFLKQLNEVLESRAIPIVQFSTTFNPTEIEEFERSGIRHFLIKPPSFYEFCDVLKETLFPRIIIES